ncbi:C-C motif chemokine 3 isoform X2 [Oreochromis niloticus]|uniref:C-C motif chemokine 3 isoform X2 n=1 Tax=Oreochromis niloticus TaxID=8128 RepID=UPI0009046AD4|nr:C-C motif chemokine 3 isoform X2 [Oreochromis niloticus]
MAQKDGGTEQGRVKTDDNLGAKAMSGGPTAGGGVVVEVREKKGPLRAAIPTMPFPLAVICLFLNTFIPGLDTFGPDKCCFQFLHRRLPANRVASIEYTDKRCAMEGVLLKTVTGRQVCADPTMQWVKKILESFQPKNATTPGHEGSE